MSREIILDTETTGIDPAQGHRIVEIGALELMNLVPTGRTLQLYINPERPVPPEAIAVHGLTDKFLSDKPVFAEVYSDFLEFIADSKLVIHNAEFDMRFINAELKKVGHEPLSWTRVVDTLTIARNKFPGSPANLDALCRRFGIDNSARKFHGALLDSELLAEVYMELLGGRQHGLGLGVQQNAAGAAQQTSSAKIERPYRERRTFAADPLEEAAHEAMVERLKKPLWREGKNAA